MKQRSLVSSIIVGLCAALSAVYAQAQVDATSQAQSSSGQAQKKKDETQSLDTVSVTGSLIPKAQIETSSPVITISAKDIQREGFKNVYDALHSLSVSTGQVEDNQFPNSFTPAANTVSLLGLDPSFTLVLLNGRPLADYPFLYNSNSNFVDLNSIPVFLVDRIDILTGNQSAIYGSSAIAGVINIILVQKMDGVTLDYRLGGYTDGGGAQKRLQIGGGQTWGKLDALFGIEFIKQDPIFGSQRSYTDSFADNPVASGRIAGRDRVEFDAITGGYDDPGKATCDAVSNLFRGDEAYRTRPGIGSYCGSFTEAGFNTLLNQENSGNAYGSLKYQWNENIQFYTDVLFDSRKATYEVGGTALWFNGQGSAPFIYDLDSQNLVSLQHRYAPEEIGHLGDATVLEHSYVFNLGVRGNFGSSDWHYDAYYHRSAYDADAEQRRLLATESNAFYLGPQDGTDPFGYGFPAYHITQTGHYWGATTPAQFLSISDIDRSDSSTYSQVANLTVTNTTFLQLPAGAVGFAGVVEAGSQYWNNPIDPRVTAGEFIGSGGTSGNGTRDRFAAAAEFNVPLLSVLTADASARYDSYSVSGSSQGKLTYKLGLEFRPIETLLFRGNYSTAFRAPDMGYVFNNGSISFVTVPDYYNCRKAQGDKFQVCNPPFVDLDIQDNTVANHDLKYITAKSFGYGVDWSPTPDFDIKADFYHIKLGNEVATYSPDTILRREADCRLGHTVDGTPVDINSSICQQTLADVQRIPFDAPVQAGTLIGVTTFPLNLSNELVSGITASTQYKIDAGRLGSFTVGADYNNTLKHVAQQFPTDPVDDYLRDGGYFGPYKTIGTGYVTWINGPWTSTVHGIRYGKTFSYDGLSVIAPWMLYNASVQYNFNGDAALSLISNNIFNSRPPRDSSYSSYPYYNQFNYSAYGRLVMVELNVHFGAGKKE